MTLELGSAASIRRHRHEIRHERQMMRIFQNPFLGPLVRRFGGPQDIVETGISSWSSRLTLSAVESGVFTGLANGPLRERELAEAVGWHPRAAGTALDALVAARLLRRDRAGRYANTIRSATFLNRSKPSHVGGLMELSSKRLYDVWSKLDELVRTGQPGAEEERGDNEFFSTIYRDPLALEEFLARMTRISTGEATLLAVRFPWKRFRTFVDIGCAQGALSVRVALTHRHLRGTGFDLPSVRPIFTEYVESFGLEDRLDFVEGDFLDAPLPRTDVVSFGHVFPGENQRTRQELIARAYDATPPGGAVIVYDAMIQPGGRDNFQSLPSGLDIMPESREGYESSTGACAELLRAGGFTKVKVRRLIGSTSAVFGYKPGRLPPAD